MSRKELEAVLDYILNKADNSEFEVIDKACQRRKADGSAFSPIGGLGPKAAAHQMASQIEEQMGCSVDNIREMLKGYVADIIREKAPEISDKDLNALLEAYAPDPSKSPPKPSPYPPEALLSMARLFIEYSEGRMAPSRQQELWEDTPDWQKTYWAAFPPDMKVLIKAYLEGRLDGDTFNTALLSLLNL